HDVQVETPALPYEATPILTVADLRDRPPASLPDHRVRIRGTVVESMPGSAITVRDATGQLHISSGHLLPVRPGSTVEVAGFPTVGPDGANLSFAVYRPDASTQPAPRKASTTPRSLPISSARDLLALTLQESDQQMPVVLRGVVTYVDVSWTMLYVQDETAGAFVSVEPQRLQADQLEKFESLKTGDF